MTVATRGGRGVPLPRWDTAPSPQPPGPTQRGALRQRGQKTPDDRRANITLGSISSNKIKISYFLPQ